jgi:hypothetical protein
MALPAAFAAAMPLALVPMGEAAQPAAFFPELEIRRETSEHEWPFSVDQGTLVCADMGGQRVVLFSEPWRTNVPQEFGAMTLPRSVVVSTNVFALFASLEDRALYLPFEGLETLVRRLAPFEAMGTRLCDRGKAFEPRPSKS